LQQQVAALSSSNAATCSCDGALQYFFFQSLPLSASFFRSLHPFALTHTPKDPAKMLLLAVAAMERSL
jgi:hypothetical protein